MALLHGFGKTSRGLGAVNEWIVFLCIFGLPWLWLLLFLLRSAYTLRRGQCLLAILDGELPEEEVTTEELSAISEGSSVSDVAESQAKSSTPSKGSFQVVDAIEVSDDDASTNSSAYSMLLAVGPGGG